MRISHCFEVFNVYHVHNIKSMMEHYNWGALGNKLRVYTPQLAVAALHLHAPDQSHIHVVLRNSHVSHGILIILKRCLCSLCDRLLNGNVSPFFWYCAHVWHSHIQQNWCVCLFHTKNKGVTFILGVLLFISSWMHYEKSMLTLWWNFLFSIHITFSIYSSWDEFHL